MVSTKIIFRTDKKNAVGEHPLYLRLIKNRKSKYIALKQYLKAEHWDDEKKKVKKSHPNSQRLNNFLAQKVADAEGVALELVTGDKYTSPQQVKDQILGRISVSFFLYSERFLKDLEQNGSYGNWCNYTHVIAKIKEYMGFRDLMLDEITVFWLKNYEMHLRGTVGNKTNTIFRNLKSIRRIINEAIKEEIFPYEKNPFLRFSLKSENVEKNFLTEDELDAIDKLQLEKGSRMELTRDLYVFASYAAGLRISDLLQLRWKNFDGERLLVQTQKTGSLVSIKLPTRALEILTSYKNDDATENSLVFSVLHDVYPSKKELHFAKLQADQMINKNLKKITEAVGINKHIHFHCSRHGFAVRALQKGMRIEYVSKLMGHASIKTTQIYAKIVNADLDNAMSILN